MRRAKVPDGFAFAVFVPAVFNLISRGGFAKNEFFRELERSEFDLRLDHLADERRAGGQNIERGGRTERSAQEIPAIQIAPTAHESLLDKLFRKLDGVILACGQIIRQEG